MSRSCKARSSSVVFSVSRYTTRQPLNRRQEKVRHLREDVKHRENSEQRILRANLDYREHGIGLADEVGMGEHDALRIGGRARGVEQRRQVALGGDDGLKVAGARGEDGIEIGGETRGASFRLSGIRFSRRRRHHQTYVESLDRFHRHRKMLHIAEQQGSPAVDQQLLHLVSVESRVERNRRSSRRR